MNWLTKKREMDAYTFNIYRTYDELSKYKWIFKYESIHEFQCRPNSQFSAVAGALGT